VVSAPRLPNDSLRGLSFLMKRGISDGELALGLRYQKGNRYWQLERVTGDERTGARVESSLVLRF
jgi:hypothetical protein